MGGNKIEIDFMLFGRNNKNCLKDVKAILWKWSYLLMVTNIDKRKLKNVVKNKQTVRKGVCKLKKKDMRAGFQKKLRS